MPSFWAQKSRHSSMAVESNVYNTAVFNGVVIQKLFPCLNCPVVHYVVSLNGLMIIINSMVFVLCSKGEETCSAPV